MAFKSPTQPYCRMCGKAIAKRTGTVWLEKPGSSMIGKGNSEFWRHIARRREDNDGLRLIARLSNRFGVVGK